MVIQSVVDSLEETLPDPASADIVAFAMLTFFLARWMPGSRGTRHRADRGCARSGVVSQCAETGQESPIAQCRESRAQNFLAEILHLTIPLLIDQIPIAVRSALLQPFDQEGIGMFQNQRIEIGPLFGLPDGLFLGQVREAFFNQRPHKDNREDEAD